MSSWRQIGVPFAVQIADKQVWLKPMTVSQRSELAANVQAMRIEGAQSGLLSVLCSQLAPLIDRIDGIDDDIAATLEVQDSSVLLELYGAILRGGTLSESESKNSRSSSDSPSPAGQGTVVIGTVETGVVSNAGQ